MPDLSMLKIESASDFVMVAFGMLILALVGVAWRVGRKEVSHREGPSQTAMMIAALEEANQLQKAANQSQFEANALAKTQNEHFARNMALFEKITDEVMETNRIMSALLSQGAQVTNGLSAIRDTINRIEGRR